MAARDHAKGSLPYGFLPIPKDVLAMPAFQTLPSGAKALMLDLMAQYTGKNNGRLCPAYEVLRRSGWRSKGTAQRNKEALLEAPFVVLTRQGHPPRTVDWIGFTWWKLDFEKSMDIDPRSFPYLNFITMKAVDPNPGRDAAKQILFPQNRGVNTRKVILRPPEMRPMEAGK